jgi:hypothetical protein
MYRRRRPTREIAFSFDSFLDVVANVVGIIIRLILVVWVGARAYTGMVPPLPIDEPIAAVATDTADEETDDALPVPEDPPLEKELEPQERELTELQKKLLEQVSLLQQARDQKSHTDSELEALAARKVELEKEARKFEQTAAKEGQQAQTAALSAEELRQRSRQLADDIKALQKLPSAKKELHYRTPVSEPLFSEQLMFECRNGRVTFIESAALLEEVKQDFATRSQEFFTKGSSTERTDPVGAFRVSYKVERSQGLVRGISVTEGVFEPVQESRGENEDAALSARSAFRQIADVIDPQQAAVTFWVYPDSFALYRRLRDYLYQKNVTVAARPLPSGSPIGWSKNGTASRGQ